MFKPLARLILFSSLAALLSLFLNSCAVNPAKVSSLPKRETKLMPSPAPAPRTLTLVAGGDVLPGFFLDPYLARYGDDYAYTALAPVFQAADIGLINLECPLSLRGKRYQKKKFTFRAKPAAAAALRRAGINAVALANNHILDFGTEALVDTFTALDEANISFAGAGLNLEQARAPASLDLSSGLKVAILSYSLTYPAAFWATAKKPGTALASRTYLDSDIAEAASWADFVVVCFHWGGELKPKPRAYQIQYGRAAIEAGANVVVGSHPHILQGMEWYQGGLILYSLGNLAFGGGKSTRATQSALVKIQLDAQTNSLSAWVLPINVNNLATDFVPEPLTGPAAEEVFALLRKRSKAWGTRIQPDASGWGRVLPLLQKNK